MKNFKYCLTIILIQTLLGVIFSASFAQSPMPQRLAQTQPATAPAQPTAVPAPAAAPAKPAAVPAQPVAVPTQPAAGAKLCDCLKPAIETIQKAYTSLEEDEWPVAIDTTKKAIDSIKTLSMSCTCPELIAYQNVADAYLKYAEGGNHLDTADEPNCPYATKLYSSAIAILEQYIPKITDSEVKANAENIKDYLEEEKDFIDDECGDAIADKTKSKDDDADD